MKKAFALAAGVALLLVGAGVAYATGGDDDYGYGGYPTSSNATTTNASRSTEAKTSTYSYKATMNVKSEVPKPNAPAKAAGNFSATTTDKAGKASIKWTLTFRNLSGKAVAAHIHKGAAGVAGAVVVPLCGPCRNGQNARTTITHNLSEALEKGGYYVNVHTAKNAGGEVRGQLKLVGK